MYISAVNKDLPTREFKENVEVSGRGKRSVTTALLVAVFIESLRIQMISAHMQNFTNDIQIKQLNVISLQRDIFKYA